MKNIDKSIFITNSKSRSIRDKHWKQLKATEDDDPYEERWEILWMHSPEESNEKLLQRKNDPIILNNPLASHFKYKGEIIFPDA